MKAAGFMAKVLDHRRVVLASVVVLVLMGLFSWMHMPRQEDPRMPDRFGMLVTVFPGADTESMERLVVIGLEEELAQVGGIKEVETRIRGEVAISRIELKDTIDEVAPLWDEVEDAVSIARRDFPKGVLEPELNKRLIGDQETAILAITGSDDPLVLRAAARKVRTRLLRLEGVSRVKLSADPGVQVTIAYDDATAKRLGISVPDLSARLLARNQIIPSGSVHVATQNVDIGPGSQFASLEELASSSVILKSGATVELSDIATVRQEVQYPVQDLMRYNGKRGVGISVIGERDINVVELGHRLRSELEVLEDEFAPLSIEILSFQPAYVEARLQGLGMSLLFGIGIVALVLILAMGLRIGLLVSVVVPVVALISIAFYAFGGGVLQQMSVAALILALGLLVDNAIVVVESAQHYLDKGLSRREAAIKAARDLAFPLATATGTTIAAFMPMLLATGSVGDFTRAIPIVTIITLVVSYFFAVLVTPILVAAGLRRRVQKKPGFMAAIGAWVSTIGAMRPKTIIVAAIVAVGLSLSVPGIWTAPSSRRRTGTNLLSMSYCQKALIWTRPTNTRG
ncbi:MAG: efflux RND transporter permease subunit [Kofleriaceae bacterium]|nr:efflux RND transporter permease subunit [Kofleriaceae bacterium]